MDFRQGLHRMDFTDWQQWRGAEVASFICTFCGLPQYRAVIKQNITGYNLLELESAKMLNKGLALAGICDIEHQKSIAQAVVVLIESEPDALAQEYDRLGGNNPVLPECGRMPRKPQPPAGPAPTKGRRPRFAVPPGGVLLPRVQTMTEDYLQEVRADIGHGSSIRLTPRPLEQNDTYIRLPGLPGEGPAGAEASPNKLQLRGKLARTEEEYVRMREADNPSMLGTGIVFGLRAVQCLHARRAAEGAATTDAG